MSAAVMASEAVVEYAVRYGNELVRDGSWHCVSDVIASFHAAYTDEHRRVTGVLLCRIDGGEWAEVGS